MKATKVRWVDHVSQTVREDETQAHEGLELEVGGAWVSVDIEDGILKLNSSAGSLAVDKLSSNEVLIAVAQYDWLRNTRKVIG